VDLHDAVLEDYYYGSLYLLGSSSRPGKPAPSLWGNFITTDNAGWGGRYFMNYNEEAPYYGVFSSNHAELAEPYNRMVLAQVPWQKKRTAEAGYQGVAYQRTFSPFTVIAKPPTPVPIAQERTLSGCQPTRNQMRRSAFCLSSTITITRRTKYFCATTFIRPCANSTRSGVTLRRAMEKGAEVSSAPRRTRAATT